MAAVEVQVQITEEGQELRHSRDDLLLEVGGEHREYQASVTASSAEVVVLVIAAATVGMPMAAHYPR